MTFAALAPEAQTLWDSDPINRFLSRWGIRNEAALVPYAARRRCGEATATSFVESAVDEIIAWRMTKKQQMRRNRATAQPVLDVRTAVLNNTLEDAFRSRHPGFRTANDDRGPTAAAA